MAPATAWIASGLLWSAFSAAFRRKETAARSAPGISSAQPSSTLAAFRATSCDRSASLSSFNRYRCRLRTVMPFFFAVSLSPSVAASTRILAMRSRALAVTCFRTSPLETAAALGLVGLWPRVGLSTAPDRAAFGVGGGLG